MVSDIIKYNKYVVENVQGMYGGVKKSNVNLIVITLAYLIITHLGFRFVVILPSKSLIWGKMQEEGIIRTDWRGQQKSQKCYILEAS